MVYGTQEFADTLKAIMRDNLRHPLYDQTVKHANEMAPHILGDKPVYLLERARPREDPEVTTYRLDNYEPTTKAGADKALDILSKMFNPSLYSIVWKEESAEIKEFQQYTLEYYPIYNSVITYDKDVLLKKMIADPNAVIAERPEFIPQNDVERIKPISVIYGSVNVHWYDKDCFIFFLMTEDVNAQRYYYYDYFDKVQYLRIKCKYEENTKSISIEILEQYQHGFNEIPAWFLRGKSKALDNGEILFESFFSSALPHWNLAVIHESDLLGGYIMHMHPQKVVWTEECEHRLKVEGVEHTCRNGIMKAVGGVQTNFSGSECSRCGGSGRSAVTSPYGEYQMSIKKLSEGQLPSGMKPVEYVYIPVDATKMLEERTREMNKKALWAINMDVEDEVGQNQSGIAKVIDRSGQYDTLHNISSVVFDVHIPNQMYFKNKYMFKVQSASANKKEDKNLPEVNKPTQFDILTTAELLNNFSVAQKANVDKNYLRVKAIEIANRDFSTSPDIKRYVIATLELDPLYGFTIDEISTGNAAGVIRKVDWTIHENLKPFIDRGIEQNKAFLTLPKQEQIKILEGFANELIKAEKPKVDPNMIINQDINAAA
jgi:hypothetical protein